MTVLGLPVRFVILVYFSLWLASCASPSARVDSQSGPKLPIGHVSCNGKIVMMRAFELNNDQNSIHAGLNGVLSAIHQPMPSYPISVTEVLIQRSDDTSASLVTRALRDNTGNFLRAPNPSIGDKILIIDGAQPLIVGAN